MFCVPHLYFSFPVCRSQMWCNQHHISTKRVFHTLETLGWRGTISTLAISRVTTNAILRNQMILIMQSDHNFLVLDKHAVLLVKLIPQLILWQWSCLRECIFNVMDFHFFMHMFDSFLQPHIWLVFDHLETKIWIICLKGWYRMCFYFHELCLIVCHCIGFHIMALYQVWRSNNHFGWLMS